MENSLTVDSGASYHMFSRCALSTFCTVLEISNALVLQDPQGAY